MNIMSKVTKILILFIGCVLSVGCYSYAQTDTGTLNARVNIVDSDLQGLFKIKLIGQKLKSVDSSPAQQDRLIIRRIGLVDEIQRNGIEKNFLEISRGISRSSFYYWKRKYRFDSLTEEELQKIRSEYQSILIEEIKTAYGEIDKLIEDIRQKAANTAIGHDDVLGDFFADTHYERGELSDSIEKIRESDTPGDLIACLDDIVQKMRNLKYQAEQIEKTKQRILRRFFSRGDLDQTAYFNFYQADNLLQQVKDKIAGLDDKEGIQKSFEYYQRLLRSLAFYFDERYIPYRNLRESIDGIIEITNKHGFVINRKEFVRDAANMTEQGV